ncbi:hypothetical protein [Curtobacterium flaccumfaciens]|uniref:hypothetical protein n=1 Tax=Curtobacterium flaccumfaciens TaxID=2035 RepID=UPI001ADAA4A0|nr:hypothetical protein [Curtobacterium flaccumfaciens]MBO9041391.1 hypothetical protein [Curtobacterium flaccumfaciens pv. flaccumfaciens]
MIIGVAVVALVSLTACSDHPTPEENDKASFRWMQRVQDRWAGQPGELGSGAGTNDSSSRLSLGDDGAGDRARIRVSVTCQGDETVQMAVWAGRFASNDGEAGRRLTSRSVHCGHDEDLYVVTSSAAITIGPTAGDGTVGWYAAAYSDLAARTR